MNTYLDEIPYNLDGIPCILGVLYFLDVAGDYSTWESDWDYYGYTEAEYDILDTDGNLNVKMTENLQDNQNLEIKEYLKKYYKGKYNDV